MSPPPHHHTHPPTPPDPEQRLLKLEEAQGFAEYRGDQLSAEVERVFAELKRLSERLDRIERRLALMGDEAESETE